MGRLTPIERAIAGQSPNRRKRWEDRMAQRGFRRMTIYAREAQVPVVEALRLVLRDMDPEDLALHQRMLSEYFKSCADDLAEDLKDNPALASDTTIEAEIAVYRAAAEATAHTERSDGGRRLDDSAERQP